MTTRSKPEIRLFIVVTAIAVTIGLLVASVALRDRIEILREEMVRNEIIGHEFGPHKDSVKTEMVVKSSWDPGESHPLIEPTNFYSTPLLDSPVPTKEYNYTEGQMERAMIVFLHPDSDLLADQTFNALREIITNEQLLESKLIAKEYDLRMKEVRRERAVILENAGVTIEDPAVELRKNLVKAFNLFSEVRIRIFQEVLSEEQRQAITKKYSKEIQAERQAAARNRELERLRKIAEREEEKAKRLRDRKNATNAK
jgi:hypothetical protein